jgi:uncharacterized protein YgiM (DUF1202 family)
MDVQSSILLQTAEALDPSKEKNRREALLESALYDYPGSIFVDDIRALIEPAAAASFRETDTWFVVIDDNVNVREDPNISSRVVTRLDQGIEVYAVEETSDEYSIDGQTARWRRIVDPAEGWVFGAWLEDIQ